MFRIDTLNKGGIVSHEQLVFNLLALLIVKIRGYKTKIALVAISAIGKSAINTIRHLFLMLLNKH